MNKENKIVPELRFPEFVNDGEWKESALENLGKFLGGGTPDRSNSDFWVGNIPWISSSDIGEDDIHNISITRFINDQAVKQSATKLIPKGNILFVSRVGVGKLAINKNELCTSQDFTSFLPVSVLNYFIAYYFSANKQLLQSLNQGTSIKGFSKSDLENFKLAYPEDPKEQQKIASCLSSLDELINAHTQKLDALKEHKKGLLQQLFPVEGETVPKLRFKEFEKDGKWVEMILDNVADYENGKAHENDIVEAGKYILVNSKFISTDGEVRKFTDSPFCLASKDDILMVLSDVPNGRAIAKCFIVDKDELYTVNQRICKLTPKGVVGIMLYYTLNRHPYLLSFDDGVKQTNLRKEDVLNCPIVLPENPNEQNQIANIFISIDEQINTQTLKIDELKEHKKGLMQGLFPTINY